MPRGRPVVSVEKRFWPKVEKTNSCWVWTGALYRQGYGVFCLSSKRKSEKAHRVSWLLSFGEPGKNCVLHKCDNRRCVRPDHLFLGDRAMNIADRDAKGRTARLFGRKNPYYVRIKRGDIPKRGSDGRFV